MHVDEDSSPQDWEHLEVFEQHVALRSDHVAGVDEEDVVGIESREHLWATELCSFPNDVHAQLLELRLLVWLHALMVACVGGVLG